MRFFLWTLGPQAATHVEVQRDAEHPKGMLLANIQATVLAQCFAHLGQRKQPEPPRC